MNFKGLFLSLLVLIPSSLKADMDLGAIGDGQRLEQIDDFSIGLFTNSSENQVPKNAARLLKNFYVDKKYNTLTKRSGWVTIGGTNTLKDFRTVAPFNKPDGTFEWVISDGSQVITSPDGVSFTQATGALNILYDLRCKQIRDKMWCTNGKDQVFTISTSNLVTFLDGSGTTPNVPRSKYIEYWQERVWLFNSTSNASSLRWNSAVSTDSIILAPDDARAWPVQNEIFVGQGDGQLGTGLRLFRGQLQASKDRSLYTIYGNSDYSYIPVKANSQVGFISNDSQAELDNYLYGQGKTAFYSYNGYNMDRITDHIANELIGVNSGVQRNVANLWSLQSDWQRGALTNSTFPVASPNLLAKSNYIQQGNETNLTSVPSMSSFTLTAVSGSTATNWMVLNPTMTIESQYIGTIQLFQIWVRPTDASITNPLTNGFRVAVKNNRTGQVCQETGGFQAPAYGDGSYQVATQQWDSATPGQDTIDMSICEFKAADIQNSSFSIKLIYTGIDSGFGQKYDVIVPTNTGGGVIQFKPSTNSQFVSDIATISTNITSWSSFEAVHNTNGALINYFYRTSTSSVNIATYPWTAIAPGTNINAPITNNYIQWAVTMNVTSNYYLQPNISQVQINHFEGSGSNTRSFGTEWLGRYWLGVTTETTGNFPLIFVKSKNSNPNNPNAWTEFDNIPIRCFAKYNDNLYGGSAATPTLVRLDYGTNDDGTAIDGKYQSPNMDFGLTFFNKNILRALVRVPQQTNGTLLLGTSVDGSSYAVNTVSINGSDVTNRVINNLNPGGKTFGRRIGFQIENKDDAPFEFNALGIIYQPTIQFGLQ